MAKTKKATIDWKLAPAPESKDHVRIEQQCGVFMGDETVATIR